MTWQQQLLALATPIGLYLLLGVLNLLLGHKSQVNKWAEENPRFAALLKLSRSLGLDPWMFLQSLSLVVRGRLPAALQVPAEAEREASPPETKRPTTIKPPPPTMVAALCLVMLSSVLLLWGCQTSVNWPAVAKCVPTEEIGKDLVYEIEGILLDGGDYEQALADLAAKYGPDGPRMVVCVVNALLGDWTDTSKPRADPRHRQGVTRARAFLKRAGTKVEQ